MAPVKMTPQWDAKTVGKLFTGRDQLPEECEKIAEYLNLGWLSVEEGQYKPVPEPPQSSALHSIYRRAHRRWGSPEHGDLKWWTWNWLREQGEPEPQFEYDTGFGIADVVGTTIGYVAECGDTPARKVRSLWEGEWRAFALFPYPDIDIEAWGATRRKKPYERFLISRLYVFRSTATGKKMLPARARAELEAWHERKRKASILSTLVPND